MKVLVIGGAGYIGSVLSRVLWEAGHDVTVLDLLLFGEESLEGLRGKPRFRLHPGDVRDEATLAALMPGHDAVCLLAAMVGEGACNRDEQTAVATNLHGAQRALAAARAAGVRRFVFASTCSNYGISDPGGLAREDSPLQPLSVYARTKVAAEREVLAAASEDFCPTVLRFSTAFGVSPRMRFDLLVSDFTLAAFRERKIVVYGEQFWRPFVHIEDIAAATSAVLSAPRAAVCGEVFNIGSNQANLQKIQLAAMVQSELAGTQVQFVAQGSDPRSYRVDFAKAAARLGFTARYCVRDGICEVHDGLRAGRWGDPADKRYYN